MSTPTTIMEWARHLLLAPTLDEKLTPLAPNTPLGAWEQGFTLPVAPGRSARLSFSEDRIKFPKTRSFGDPLARAQAVHSFANHELLAIEMMAAALLLYPHAPHDEDAARWKRGIALTIQDEQKHLALYVDRLRVWGRDFGDYPLNDFFWNQMPKLKTPANFFALMALTFESANLDFALHYEAAFRAVGDHDTAEVLKIVLEDEIGHVALGGRWLDRWRGDEKLWDYYRSVLPFPITPARAKGIDFNRNLRVRAGLSVEWVDQLENYQDAYGPTRRPHASPQR